MSTNLTHNYWLGTNSGKVIDLLNPDPAEITIEDIATGLSHVCRFNGQLKSFYSVAQHSMYVASMVAPKFKLQALLHDATEAFICDIPTPLKRLLGESYYAIERRLAHAIGEKFNADLINLHASVRKADSILCTSERDSLQKVPLSWGPERDDELRYPGGITHSMSHTGVISSFITRFNEYKGIEYRV